MFVVGYFNVSWMLDEDRLAKRKDDNNNLIIAIFKSQRERENEKSQ